MSRATLGTIVPASTSGTTLAALLSARDAAENSGHSGPGRPTYATAGMIYTEDSGPVPKLFLAIGASGPDIDLSAIFADRPGTMRTTAEVLLPAGWLWCDGSTPLRATYPALFDAICPPFTGTLASGSTAVSAVSVDLQNLGLIGTKIEGAGIPPNTTIIAVPGPTSLTLSAAASAPAVGTSLRVFPHGNGNGSTTFNLPNAKGRVIVPRQNMGGADAGLITVAGSAFDATKLGNVGGAQNFLMTTAHLPPHSHTASTSGTALAAGAHAHNVSGATSTIGNHTHATQGPGNFMTLVPAGTGILPVAGTGTKSIATDLNTGADGSHAHSVTGSTDSQGTHAHTLDATTTVNPSTGGGTAVPQVQPSLIENVVIKI